MTSTGVTCFGESDGSAASVVSGGTLPYTYLWSNGDTNASATGLTAGNYDLTVSDANGCALTGTTTISEPNQLLASISASASASCNGASDGTATVSVSGGTTAYSYLWDSGAMTATASNLTAGLHVVTVTDSNACTTTASISISEPTPLSASNIIVAPITCFGAADGGATSTPIGGTAPYTYVWSGGLTGASITGLSAGNYTLTVTDANGCSATGATSLTASSALTASVTGIAAASCAGDLNGAATIVATGGTSAYTYLWDNGETTPTVTNLAGGMHTATVTDLNGCTTTVQTNISEPQALATPSVISTPVSCFGGSDGSLAAALSGGTPPYSYTWNGGSTTATLTGLSAGTYDLTVTDDNGCTILATAMVTEPSQLVGNISGVSAVSCNGGSSGSATVVATGGTSPYAFAWDNGENSATATQLDADNHIVTITDTNGCTTTSSVTITEPNALAIAAINATAVSCAGGSDGSLTGNITGGTAPYSFAWDNGMTTATISGLSAGTYILSVSDANGCTNTSTANILEPTALVASIASSTAASCNGFSDGTATVTTTGGTMPYAYNWSNGESGATASNLPATTNTVTVTDGNACTTVLQVTISEPTALALSSVTASPTSCFGLSDGAVQAVAAGGTAPYTYNWGAAGNGNTISGLPAGNYPVTVTDDNGCIAMGMATVTEPMLLVATISNNNGASCNGVVDGTATITATGGTAPYTYNWDNGEVTATATALSATIHTATITDNNGCTTTLQTTITEPAVLGLSALIATDVSCFGDADGTLTATASGGTGPYVFAWSNGMVGAALTGLTTGTYVVTVSDANGCAFVSNETIGTPAPFSIAVLSQDSVSCAGGIDGSAAISVSGGSAPYSYLWDNGAITANPTNLPAGVNTVTATDANNCTAVFTVVIDAPNALDLGGTAITDASCNGESDGSIAANPIGGTAPYSYAWSTGEMTATITGLSAGSYTLTLTDANACSLIESFLVQEPGVMAGIVSVLNNASCTGAADGQAQVLLTGGTMPYTYAWDTGESTPIATQLSAGIHTVTVTGANACSWSGSVTISDPLPLGIVGAIQTDSVSCFGLTDGLATVNVSGGTAPYSYTWDGTTTTSQNFLSGLSGGWHNVVVSDANNCSLGSQSFFIGAPDALALSVVADNLSCSGGMNGMANALVSGGTEDYAYAWSNGETTNPATGFVSGNHSVTVTDAKGCAIVETFSMSEPTSLFTIYGKEDNVCFGDEGGVIRVDSTFGGVEPYVYSLNGGSFTPSTLFDGLAAGTYTLTTQDMNGCEFTQSITLTSESQLTLDLGPDVFVELGENGEIQATTNATGPLTWEWSPPLYLACENGDSTLQCTDLTIVQPLENITYTVTLTDGLGCTVQDQLSVVVGKDRNIYIPNAFTPNGDNINDVLMIFSDNAVGVVRTFKFFDRWGELLWEADNFQPNDPMFGWDGTFKGQPMNPGVFVYFAEIEFLDGQVQIYKGDVTLIR